MPPPPPPPPPLPPVRRPRRRARAAMALSKLSGDEQGIVFVQLCNVLNPHLAVALSSASNELRTATQALLPQLRTDHEVAAALCLKLGIAELQGAARGEVGLLAR